MPDAVQMTENGLSDGQLWLSAMAISYEEQLDCVLDMTCKYLYLHLCFQTRIILLVCTLVCSHNIGLPMYLSGKLASLLACSLKLATWYFCCVVCS